MSDSIKYINEIYEQFVSVATNPDTCYPKDNIPKRIMLEYVMTVNEAVAMNLDDTQFREQIENIVRAWYRAERDTLKIAAIYDEKHGNKKLDV